MGRVKVKAYAKINLTLDILGVEEGYHKISSLLSTVTLYDLVSVKKRRDDKITLKTYGISTECELEKNTAYKAAKLFKEKFNTSGVTISIQKNIPIGGGLGGSSADIAGVLLAMKKLFNVKEDVKPLADALGSDSGFLLTGGYAVIEGRGEKVTPIESKQKLYFLIMPAKSMVTAGASYKEFDRLGEYYTPVTDEAVRCLLNGDTKGLIKVCKNDLYNASANLCPEIERNIEFLSKYAKTVMTGSGSCVVSIYSDKAEWKKRFAKILGYGLNAIKVETFIPKTK